MSCRISHKFFNSLTDNSIQFTDKPTFSREESRVNVLLPPLFDSQVHPTKIQSKETRSGPFSPGQQCSNSTDLRASTKKDQTSLARPNRFRNNPQVFTQKGRESYLQRRKPVRRPKFIPSLQYTIINAFSSWEIVFWDYERQEYTIQKTALPSQRLVVPLSVIEVQHGERH